MKIRKKLKTDRYTKVNLKSNSSIHILIYQNIQITHNSILYSLDFIKTIQMANIGRYIERNPGIRAAGLTSTVQFNGAKDCLFVVSLEEEAEDRIRALCRRSRPKPAKRTPKLPTHQIGDILNNENPGLFAELQNKFRENMFHKKPGLGEARETNSKPSYVTNLSHTFGKITQSNCNDSLYSIVLPPKSAEQVNREYGEYHDKHIISHNHYFPAEQINRRSVEHFTANIAIE